MDEARTKVTEDSNLWVMGAARLGDCVVTQPVPIVEVTVIRDYVGIVVNKTHFTCKIFD